MELNLLLAMILIFIGSFVQSATGFGLAVVAAPILIYISPEYIPGPLVFVGLFLALINAYGYRATISLQGLWGAIIGRIPGSVAGAVMLYYIDADQLSLLLGIVVLMAVVISLLPFKLQPTPGRLLIAGFLSGFFGTSSGIGGPPMALLLQHQQANLIRVNLSAFFVASCLISLTMQVPIGYMSWHHVYLALPLLPAGYLGYFIAMRFVDRLSQKWIRYTSLFLCMLSGCAALFSGLVAIVGH